MHLIVLKKFQDLYQNFLETKIVEETFSVLQIDFPQLLHAGIFNLILDTFHLLFLFIGCFFFFYI